jgi:hypothetical protein
VADVLVIDLRLQQRRIREEETNGRLLVYVVANQAVSGQRKNSHPQSRWRDLPDRLFDKFTGADVRRQDMGHVLQ